jgi:hypothetical protein
MPIYPQRGRDHWMNDVEGTDDDAAREDAESARWVEQSRREVEERRAKELETPWARRDPERTRKHVAFALALTGLSGDRTKRFLSWIKGKPGVPDDRAGGGGGGGH